MNPVTALVLAAGVRLVDAVLPGDGPARAPDDPGEVRDRVLRALALGAVLVAARRLGRRLDPSGGRAGRRRRVRGRRGRRRAP